MLCSCSFKVVFICAMIGFLCSDNSLRASPQSETVIAFGLTRSVVSYPQKIQEIDALFEAKCLKCHGTK